MIYYTIYQITNLINNKIYIGKHQTKYLNDDYFGSGKLISRAIEKYKIENFKKEILHIFDNEEEMNNKEKELVTIDFCLREDTYNETVGGYGGFYHINNKKVKSYYVQKAKDSWFSRPESERIEINKKKAQKGENNFWYGKDHSGKNNPRYNVVVTSITREKISNSNKGKKRSEKYKKEKSELMKKLWFEGKIKRKPLILSEKARTILSEKMKKKKWWTNGISDVRSELSPGTKWKRGRSKKCFGHG